MANTIDQNDPYVAWTVQKPATPTDASLTAGQLALRQYHRAAGNVINEDNLPDVNKQIAAGQNPDQANFFLVVADTTAEQNSFRNGSVQPTFYAQWKTEADPA